MSTLPSSAALLSDATAGTPRPRVLVLRSCRPQVFDQALAAVRARLPHAAVTVVAPQGARTAFEADHLDVVETARSRFGLRALLSRPVRALRHEGYDWVCIPQMNASAATHMNLYRFVIGLGAPAVLTFAPGQGLTTFTRRAFLSWTTRQWLAHLLDVPMTLGLAAVAPFMPRRRRPRAGARPRVLCVITSWGVGGAQRQLAEFIRHVPPDAAEVELFVLARVDGDFSSRHLGDRKVTITYASHWPALRPTVLELARLCRARSYDVVHTWLFLANVVGAIAARLAGVPRVIGSVRNLSLWKRTWANQWWFRAADCLAARAADVVTVNATPLVRDHAAWAGLPASRILVVPNGLAPAPDADVAAARAALRARLGLAPDAVVTGTVGRLAEEKAHTRLIDAWPQVRASHPAATLVIAGEGPLGPALRARGAAMDAGIVFTGESCEATALMAGLDLFVLPSRIEGFANVLLEAAQLGVPIVATDVGAARDVVGDPSDLVPADDVTALAGALARALGDLPAAQARAGARRARVRAEFSADRMVGRWLSLYHGAPQ